MNRLPLERAAAALGLILMAALSTACSAEAGQQASSAEASLTSPAPEASAGPGESITEVLANRGFPCIREADILRRPLSDDELQAMAAAVANVRDADGWVAPDKDVLADGQAFVGSVAAAAKSVGGELIGPPSDQWILATRDGAPFAFQLEVVDLPGGKSAWRVGDRMRPAECS